LEATSPAEAALARGVLEPEGIPCLVEGRGVGDVANYELHKVPYQTVPNVYVPRAAEGRARELLEAAWGRALSLPRARDPAVSPRTSLLFLAACLIAMVGFVVWVAR
jgi:hypothetical protein